MSERKYSVNEIDRMRKAVDDIVTIGGTDQTRAAIKEEHLRTYMLNGTDPEELEACAISSVRMRQKAALKTLRA